MPTKLCLEPHCPNPATGRGRCDECRGRLERGRSRRCREEDNPKRRHGIHVHHTKRWLATRGRVLFLHPVCQECGRALSEHVHHVIPITVGGAPYALDNLLTLCARCHNRISRREQRAAMSTTRAPPDE